MNSLLARVFFFVIPIAVSLLPVIGFAPRIYRWLHVRPINRLHHVLASLEHQLAYETEKPRIDEYRARLAEIESAMRSLKVARPFEVDLQQLRIHLRMVQDEVDRMATAT